jgi:hypothetical protein
MADKPTSPPSPPPPDKVQPLPATVFIPEKRGGEASISGNESSAPASAS